MSVNALNEPPSRKDRSPNSTRPHSGAIRDSGPPGPRGAPWTAHRIGHEPVHLGVADGLDMPRQLADAIAVDFHAEADLGLDFVPLGDGHLPHVVAQASTFEFRRSCAGSRPHPPGQPLLRLRLLPMADDHFARLPQPRADVAELAVAVRRLVQVHEVHVDRVPGQIAIELRMQMGQRLLQRLEARDPHLRRRKRVHPADHADAAVAALASRHAWRIDSAVVTTL